MISTEKLAFFSLIMTKTWYQSYNCDNFFSECKLPFEQRLSQLVIKVPQGRKYLLQGHHIQTRISSVYFSQLKPKPIDYVRRGHKFLLRAMACHRIMSRSLYWHHINVRLCHSGENKWPCPRAAWIFNFFPLFFAPCSWWPCSTSGMCIGGTAWILVLRNLVPSVQISAWNAAAPWAGMTDGMLGRQDES